MTRTAAAKSRFTLDTNLLVYSVDSKAGRRHESAIEIITHAAGADCWLTLQSLSEFYVVATQKRLMPAVEAAAQAEDWLQIFPCAAVSAGALRTALADAVAGRASYWDALLVATAREAGCTLILTEDLGHGSSFGGVEIHYPFTMQGRLTARTRALLEL